MYKNGFTGESDEGEVTLTCPDCGADMGLIDTKDGRYYSCDNYPRCRVSHGCHSDGSPLGVPGDKETRRARMEAHVILDKIWKGGYMSRTKVYETLARYMRLSTEDCHLAMFSKEQCDRAEQFARGACKLYGINVEVDE